MFCNKCGKELPDNATFCSGCGNQVGAVPAPAATAGAAQLPPIISRFVQQFVGFFTKKNPVGVVCASAKDSSFSGLIFAVIGMLFMALGTMVNVNQAILTYGKKIEDEDTAKEFIKKVSGTSFGMTLLAVAVVYLVAVILMFVVTNYIAKKPLSLSGACNIVAYASIPMVCVSIINMLAGLIWFVLPVVFMLIAGVVTLILMSAALNNVCGGEKPSLLINGIYFAVLAVVALLFAWIALKGMAYEEELYGYEYTVNFMSIYSELWFPSSHN